MAAKNVKKPEDSNDKTVNWQAKKSAMTRVRILDAAIDCFVKHGFNKLTNINVANMAGISPGAMRYHFSSKKVLIQAAIEYLHENLLKSYFDHIADVSESLPRRERIRARLDTYWKYINTDLFRVSRRLCMVAQTEPALNELLKKSVKDFECHARKSVMSFLGEWQGQSEKLFFVVDTTRFLLEGMASGDIETLKDERIERQLVFLSTFIEESLDEDGSTKVSKLLTL